MTSANESFTFFIEKKTYRIKLSGPAVVTSCAVVPFVCFTVFSLKSSSSALLYQTERGAKIWGKSKTEARRFFPKFTLANFIYFLSARTMIYGQLQLQDELRNTTLIVIGSHR